MEFFQRSVVTDPEILSEWNQWLVDNFDPGHYDACKERDPKILPYVEGKPQWYVEVYMPPHLVEKWRRKQQEQK